MFGSACQTRVGRGRRGTLVELSLQLGLGVGCGPGTLRSPSPHLASSLSLSPTSALIAANIQLATILN